MLRVGDLQRSIDFYTRVLGMKLLRTTERPEQKYSLAFVGYGTNPEHAEIELTYNHGVDSYELGTAYGHIALGVPDVYAACEKIRAAAATSRASRGRSRAARTVIAFVTDPDGYKIELIQRGPGRISVARPPSRASWVMRAPVAAAPIGIGRRQPGAADAGDVGQRQELRAHWPRDAARGAELHVAERALPGLEHGQAAGLHRRGRTSARCSRLPAPP